MIKMLTFTVSVFVVFSVWYIHDTREQTIPVAESAGKIAEAPAVSGLEQPVAPRVGRWVDVVMNVSAFCAPCEICCAGANDGITASGYDVRERSVSYFLAAPKQIPIGTVICVPGYNNGSPVVVLDRMPGKGRKLDCYFPTHQAALNFGRNETLTVQLWRMN